VPARKPSNQRKDRIVQARVNESLDERLKEEAARRRLPVSQLIRNLLEDTFSLVGNVVDNVDTIARDAVDLGRQAGDDAARLMRNAQSNRPDAPVNDDVDEDAIAHVFAWQGVVSNTAQSCARCGRGIARGDEAFVGLTDQKGPRAWICGVCREQL
jgi:hypothetical protein